MTNDDLIMLANVSRAYVQNMADQFGTNLYMTGFLLRPVTDDDDEAEHIKWIMEVGFAGNPGNEMGIGASSALLTLSVDADTHEDLVVQLRESWARYRE